jgi:hypothetical protein
MVAVSDKECLAGQDVVANLLGLPAILKDDRDCLLACLGRCGTRKIGGRLVRDARRWLPCLDRRRIGLPGRPFSILIWRGRGIIRARGISVAKLIGAYPRANAP